MRGSEEARAAGAWPQAGASAGQEAPRREEERGAGERAVRVARGLGLASLGLGVAGIAAPRRLAELIGLGRDPAAWTILRVIGGREIAAGLGLLRRPRDTGRLLARVVGDAMDLALLGTALRLGRGDRGRLATATAVTAGVALIDVMAARRLGRAVARMAGTSRRAIHVERTVTINRAPDEVYRFWRELENLPRFMTHLASVRAIDDRRSRWTVKGPAGSTVSWEAEICDDRPGELLSWRSVGAAEVPNAGTVWFTRAPGGRGTEVRVELRYDAPGGQAGAAIARLLGRSPGVEIAGDLRRLKQVLETGEVVYSDASVHRGPHPGRPPERTFQPPAAPSAGGAPTTGAAR
ncbi:MAG TPA: SRPBCC family protein [Kofleriaceae bacterium]|nr:SRPBCC family protein [Kofleriaceae bacterium]